MPIIARINIGLGKEFSISIFLANIPVYMNDINIQLPEHYTSPETKKEIFFAFPKIWIVDQIMPFLAVVARSCVMLEE